MTRAEPRSIVGVIRFELLADLDDQPAGAAVVFEGSVELGAPNLRGTGFAVRDIEVRELRARDGAMTNESFGLVASRRRHFEAQLAGIAGMVWPQFIDGSSEPDVIAIELTKEVEAQRHREKKVRPEPVHP